MQYPKWIKILVAVVMLAFVPPANAATDITFWTSEVSHDKQAVIKYLAQAFMVFNPDITVHVVGVEENSIVDALSHVQSNGDGPDVVGCASDLIVSFNNHGWVDCHSAGRIIASIGKDRFYHGALAKLQVADGCYSGIPFNGWIQGIWYRKDWFQEHGLAPPDNWDAIMQAAKTLHDPANGQYGILIGTRGDAYAEQVFTHLALSAGVREFTAEGEVVFDSPETVEVMKYYTELARYTPPGPQWWRGRDYYLQGRLGMMFYSSFIMDDLAIPSVAANSLTGSNFSELKGAAYDYRILKNTGMISCISGVNKASYGMVNALAVLRNDDAEKSMAAERFVQFLFTEEAYVTWLHMVPGGMLPVLRDTSESAVFFRDAQGVFRKYSRQRVQSIISGFDSLGSFSFMDGILLPQAAQASAVGIIPEMIADVLSNGATPEQAVSHAAARMRNIAKAQSKTP